MATAVTEQSFEQEVLQSETPVLVDFWAEWCGPCHAVAPVLDRIVDERNGDLKLVKVNIDEEQGLAARYQGRGARGRGNRRPAEAVAREGPRARLVRRGDRRSKGRGASPHDLFVGSAH